MWMLEGDVIKRMAQGKRSPLKKIWKAKIAKFLEDKSKTALTPFQHETGARIERGRRCTPKQRESGPTEEKAYLGLCRMSLRGYTRKRIQW